MNSRAPQPIGGHAAVDLPGRDLDVHFVDSLGELEAWLPAWRRLIETAAEPNVYNEPEVLLPSLRFLGGGSRRRGVVLVSARPRQDPSGDVVLAGLFPFEGRRGRGGLWLHRYAFLGTPLIRSDSLDDTWTAFLNGAESTTGAGLLRLPKLDVDGAVFRSLLGVLHALGRVTWVQDQHVRALFRARSDAEAFVQESVSRKVRRNLKRQRRLLAETGEVAALAGRLDPAEADAWCERFLALEASGWKGARGSALGSQSQDRRWFHDVVSGLAAQRRCLVASLGVEGRPVAMGVIFAAAPGDPTGDPRTAQIGAYFKVAYDEEYARFSVGALLQLDLVEALHGPEGLSCVDSCADPGHPMIDHLWRDRRMIQTLWVASRRRRAHALLGALPLARAAKQILRPR